MLHSVILFYIVLCCDVADVQKKIRKKREEEKILKIITPRFWVGAVEIVHLFKKLKTAALGDDS